MTRKACATRSTGATAQMLLARALALVLLATGHGSQALAVESSTGPAGALPEAMVSASFVNRSLITIGSDVFTSLDGRLLLAIWNALAQPAVPMVTDFESDPSSWTLAEVKKEGESRTARLSRYAPDARRLLYIFFVWEESRRLGLFVPSEKALDEAQQSLTKSDFLSSSPVDVRRYWSALGASGQRVYLNMVLRAKSYLRVRGDLAANPRLGDTVWFWHGLSNP